MSRSLTQSPAYGKVLVQRGEIIPIPNPISEERTTNVDLHDWDGHTYEALDGFQPPAEVSASGVPPQDDINEYY